MDAALLPGERTDFVSTKRLRHAEHTRNWPISREIVSDNTQSSEPYGRDSNDSL